MFSVRAHTSERIDKRQNRTFYEITANGANIPVEGENWLQRWCSLPMDEKFFKRFYEFHVKDDDVYVVTFPKTGTTRIQEAVWLLMNDLDFTTANSIDMPFRSVYMDLSGLYTSISNNTIDLANEAASPRVLKSHMPAHLLPKQVWEKKSKIVYCTRNPKDTIISFFHFHQGLGTWQGNINDFVEDFINNDILYTPYWEHVMDFWRMREEKNIFFVTFEDMKRNMRQILIDLNEFLEKPPLTEEQLDQLEQHLSFESMKANKHVNPTYNIKSGHGSPLVRKDFEFMRRGIVGSYKDELTLELQKKLDDWIDENTKKFNIKMQDIFGEI